MGQFAVKIKQMAERLELNKDKRNPTRLSKSLLEISNKQTSTTDLRSAGQQTRESIMLLEVMSKLELIETVVENQRQIMGDQEAKLRALENTVRNAQVALSKVKKTACEDEVSDVEASRETPLGRLFDSIFQEKSKNEEDTKDPQEMIRQHEETLKNHEQRIEAVIEKIQIIWDRIMQDKESNSRLDAQQEEINELKKMVDCLRHNHDALKTESHSELEIQQKTLDNLFAGFVVAFLLLVFICINCK
ncbi:uncharacterized protein LOC116304617 [Actinia tenebrosa]|uniref:Uncharacterized protein LOC116304617 n=1 Tax=Actinia tenebrosa TaxID=6105 RepID=A0A6P8ITA8_ACTTE|nr:uncharacterized protein LOC116304617 [Actinia tenebrosa]